MAGKNDDSVVSYIKQYEVKSKIKSNVQIADNFFAVKDYQDFIQACSETLSIKNQQILELPTKVSHVRYQIKISLDVPCNDLEQDLMACCAAMYRAIESFLSVNDAKKITGAWVLRCFASTDDWWHTTVRIHFPDVMLSRERQRYLHRNVIAALKYDECLTRLRISPWNMSDSLDDMIDHAWVVQPCAMLESGTSDEAFRLEHIAIKDNTSICWMPDKKLKSIKTDRTAMFKRLSVVMPKTVKSQRFSEAVERDYRDIREDLHKVAPVIKPWDKDQENVLYSEIEALLKLLDVRRVIDPIEWISVGAAIHDIFSGKRGLSLFYQFSERAPKPRKKRTIARRWKELETKPERYKWITRTCLPFWALHDDPQGYMTSCVSTYTPKISEKTFRAKEVADITMKAFGHLHCFVTPSKGNRTYWMHFRDHRWQEDGNATNLKQVISETMPRIFIDKRRQYIQQQGAATVPETEERFENLAKQCQRIADQLTERRNIEQVIFFCQQKCQRSEEQIEALMNEHRGLMGFTDGVVDVTSGKVVFRPGRPDDWVRKTVGIPYPGRYDPSTDHAVAFRRFRESIHPGIHAPVGQYIWDIMALCINGWTKQQFLVMTGGGANGKSIFTKIIRLVFGGLYCTLPPTVLTQKRGNSGDASPELYKAKGARIAIMQEPDFDDNFNVGQLKELTGGDPIYCRNLYTTPITYVPQCIWGMTCNKKPTYVDPTNATKRRMRIIPFPVTFCDNPEERTSTEENPVAHKDATLDTRVSLWTQTVAAYLLHRYARVVNSAFYKKFGEPDVPQAVRDATDDYDSRCNIVKTWIKEELEYADPDSDDFDVEEVYRLDQTEAFQAYREWCRLFGHQIKPIEFKEELKHEFKRRNIRLNVKKKAWFGVRLMEIDEDDC